MIFAFGTVLLLLNISFSSNANISSLLLPNSTIIFDTGTLPVDQRYILLVLQNYTKLRNVYGEPPLLTSHVNIAILIATTLNFSLTSKRTLLLSGLSDEYIDELNLPTIRPLVTLTRTLKLYSKLSPNISVKYSRITFLNFGYCDAVYLSNKISIAELIQNTASHSVWILLMISIIFVSVFSKKSFSTFSSSEPVFRYADITKVISTKVISVLICPGVSGSSEEPHKKSVLFVLWMFACTIFVQFYSGVLTSRTIQPPNEKRMTDLKDLVESKYSFVFEHDQRQAMMKTIFQREQNYSLEQTAYLKTNIVVLHQLLGKIKIGEAYKSQKELIPNLSNAKAKVAVIDGSYTVLFYISKAIEYIQKTNQKSKCFVGENLVYPQLLLATFEGSISKELAHTWDIIWEAGIYEIWSKEFFGYSSSFRVQDRSKIKDETKIRNGKDEPQPLRIKGKLINVFLLWVICVGFAIISFATEIFKHFFKMISTNFFFLSFQYK